MSVVLQHADIHEDGDSQIPQKLGGSLLLKGDGAKTWHVTKQTQKIHSLNMPSSNLDLALKPSTATQVGSLEETCAEVEKVQKAVIELRSPYVLNNTLDLISQSQLFAAVSCPQINLGE